MNLFSSLLITDLWAASGAVEEGHGASLFQLIYPLINFLIFAYLLKRFLFPIIRDYLRERRDKIASAVKGAEEDRARAEAMVREYQDRLARLETEAKEIRESLRQEGERGRARLFAEAQELAARIKADANFLAEQEIKEARHQIRAELALMAQQKATDVLGQHLTTADQKRLVEEFTQGLREVR